MRVDTKSGEPVWGTSTRRANRPISMLNGRAKAELIMPSMPLLEGTYELTVAVTDWTESHPYDHWEKRIRFDVRQYKSNDIALVDIPTEWIITGESAEPVP